MSSAAVFLDSVAHYASNMGKCKLRSAAAQAAGALSSLLQQPHDLASCTCSSSRRSLQVLQRTPCCSAHPQGLRLLVTCLSTYCSSKPNTRTACAGEEPHTGIIAAITAGPPNIVTCVEDERLQFQVGFAGCMHEGLSKHVVARQTGKHATQCSKHLTQCCSRGWLTAALQVF